MRTLVVRQQLRAGEGKRERGMASMPFLVHICGLSLTAFGIWMMDERFMMTGTLRC